MPRADADLEGARVAWFDDLARLTIEPDAHVTEIRSRYGTDEGLRVPERVFNAIREQSEAL